MLQQDNDIILTNHCIDDAVCPVDDRLKELQLLELSDLEKHEACEYDRMQASAIDTYHTILSDTGDVRLAEKAFFDIHHDYYEHH